MTDFFISYTRSDQAWAEWIAWTLEAAGYSTVIQAWDFLAGSNFVLEMQRAATEANQTIAVLSQKYLDSSFTQPEWAAAFAQDPQGKKQKLIPVRIAACELKGFLAPIVYLDLVGLPENDARTALLGAFSRNKPAVAPVFPDTRTPQVPPVSSTQPGYPVATARTSAPVAEILSAAMERADQTTRLSAAQRFQFIRQLSEIVPQQFNMLLFAVNPPSGLIPPMPAAQGDRTAALLTWAEAPSGCGFSVLKQLLDTFVNPQASSTPTLTPEIGRKDGRAGPEKIYLGRLPVTGGDLFGREENIAFLDDAWANQHVNIVTVVAWAGVGKSTLVNHWLQRIAGENYRSAKRVFGWSFDRQAKTEDASSADQFLDVALAWFGDLDPRIGTAWEKGERLAKLIKDCRTLF